jgi:segregation and condensation protein B
MQLISILEAAILAAGRPVNVDTLLGLFDEGEQPSRGLIVETLEELHAVYEDRPLELKKVATGYRFQVREGYSPWLSRLFEERPGRYSRAFLETLAIIAYRQPVTRGEIEDIRGVAVSSGIIKTMLEREWIRVIGHKELPGRPALFATTAEFLDYFSLGSLSELPPLQTFIDELGLAAAADKLDHALPNLTDVSVNLIATVHDEVQDETQRDEPEQEFDEDHRS